MRDLLFLLLGSALTALGSLAVLFFRTRARRADIVYEKRVDRLFELEELAGHLTEYLGSYEPTDWDKKQLVSEHRRMKRLSGSFRRYDDVTQAVRDFRQAAGWILHQGGRTEFSVRGQEEDAVEALYEGWDDLTAAIDRALSEHGVLSVGDSRSPWWRIRPLKDRD